MKTLWTWIKRIFKALVIVLVLGLFLRATLVMLPVTKDDIAGDRIALVDLSGVIVDSREFIDTMDRLDESDRVKGIILRVNSPGGIVTPSQEIFERILRIDKPVYASFATVAASGGYYVGVATDRIYAMPSTITGSIGVIMEFTNLEGLMGKIGVDTTIIKSGKYKDIGNPNRPMTEADRAILQKTIMDIYDQFFTAVATRRSMEEATLSQYADGRILTGNQALAANLVDRIGSVHDAYTDMKADLGLEDDVPLIEVRKEEGPFHGIFGILKDMNARQISGGFYYLYRPDAL